MATIGFATTAKAQTKRAVPEKKAVQSKRKIRITHLFNGFVERVDLQDHPMTLLFKGLKRSRSEVVHSGILYPQTIVFKGGKSAGVKSLKKGEKVMIFYKKRLKRVLIVKIRILPEPVILTRPHKTKSF
jgi:hypothetical protein